MVLTAGRGNPVNECRYQMSVIIKCPFLQGDEASPGIVLRDYWRMVLMSIHLIQTVVHH